VKFVPFLQKLAFEEEVAVRESVQGYGCHDGRGVDVRSDALSGCRDGPQIGCVLVLLLCESSIHLQIRHGLFQVVGDGQLGRIPLPVHGLRNQNGTNDFTAMSG
jgi:hypothetical protein